MTGWPAETLSAVVLAAVLAFAVVRPKRLPEAVAAVPGALLLLATGAVSLGHAREEVQRLGPVVGFLAAVLVLAQLCDGEGLFAACGAWMARAAGSSPQRLLVVVFVLASVTTAALSLDATVVLLTPVVFATAARVGARPKPHVYACAHLSNTASLLLPVSNLTNLLALATAGLSFTRFAALMALPWLVAIAVEYVVTRRFFARDLAVGTAGPWSGPPPAGSGSTRHDAPERAEAPPSGGSTRYEAADAAGAAGEPEGEPPVPVFALWTVAGTLAAFVGASVLDINPAWAAFAGAAVLAVRALLRRRTTPAALVRAADVPFLLFVLALGVVVRALVDNGLGDALGRLVPDGQGLPALLLLAALAAVLANVINNLPAVLVLLPLAAPSGPGAALAVLIGVDIGPNLTYAGSLATLLWRRVVHAHDTEVELGEFTRLGLLTVPAALVVAVVALWAGLQVMY
ncbi:SLC13 family permease [Actinacidiphila yeochonensis]|uniref:SLC13 family permease n=1 Tax=Actinacidiphila yeochonensis TaxID=89050 RepID=UPI0005640751|nr:SLC13 family permease [Actinacidiphila yeochonensis]